MTHSEHGSLAFDPGDVMRLEGQPTCLPTPPTGCVVLTDGPELVAHRAEHIASPSDEVVFEHVAAAVDHRLLVFDRGTLTTHPERRMIIFDLLGMRQRYGRAIVLDLLRDRNARCDLGALVVQPLADRAGDLQACADADEVMAVWTIYALANNGARGRRAVRETLGGRTSVSWPSGEAALAEVELLLDSRSPDR